MAITSLTVLENDQAPPPGWEKIDVDLNEGADGEYLYFAYEGDGSKQPITDIYFLIGREQPTPSGYEKINVDLNKGADGAYIYATFTRASGDAVQDLEVITSTGPSVAPPPGFKRIDVDLNRGADGRYIYLCYRT
ncbi:hypothetical protein [Streptomyces prasinopilosus]|uniref:hypothetical protein n=1 Tax=Streptomyces prasinopilosus TaxID=67344 RepID=UPI0006EBB325|nr:hypothetical protein [Streptomyces prasinopilosus]